MQLVIAILELKNMDYATIASIKDGNWKFSNVTKVMYNKDFFEWYTKDEDGLEIRAFINSEEKKIEVRYYNKWIININPQYYYKYIEVFNFRNHDEYFKQWTIEHNMRKKSEYYSLYSVDKRKKCLYCRTPISEGFACENCMAQYSKKRSNTGGYGAIDAHASGSNGKAFYSWEK